MRLNTKVAAQFGTTWEGAPAKRITDEQALRRSILSCMLWENEFYEDGKAIADRIMDLSGKVDATTLANLAVETRHKANLRHVPLLLLVALIKHHRGNPIVAQAIADTIGRADELAELLAIYWKDGKKPLSAQMKKGLAKAFTKFGPYALAKYNRGGAIKLRDVLFLCHAKPANDEQKEVWKKLIDGTLESPDTWEVNLSGGADKKETFERLIREGKLGYLALLRNLRNMVNADCDLSLVREAITARKNGADKVLPFRFVAAARAAPMLEPDLDTALCEGIDSMPALKGRTAVLVDVSGSMDSALACKSDLTRMDAAAALASVLHAEELRVFSFSEHLVEVPPRRGMAGIDTIIRSQSHSGTRLGGAMAILNREVKYDRVIVITDEQSADRVPDPLDGAKGYMINVASYKNGIGYGRWTHIDGFSESVIRYIVELESSDT